MSKKKSSGNYAVGHGKPPMSTRFQKGKSGNPSGRPRRAPLMLKTVAKILAKTQNVMIEGESRSMSLEELFLTSVIQNGIRGKNAKSMMQTLEWIREVDVDRAEAIALANETRVRVTAESLKGLNLEELHELYNRTMDPDYRPETDPILLRHAKRRD